MSFYFNDCTLIGRVTDVPNVQSKYAVLMLETESGYKDNSKKEYIKVIVDSPGLIKTVQSYVKTDSKLFINGQIKLLKDGSVALRASVLVLGGSYKPYNQQQQQQSQQGYQQSAPNVSYSGGDDDDLPF